MHIDIHLDVMFVFQLDPVSGPVEGGTVVTISGSNLGQRAEDIQNYVFVAGVPCSVIQSRYEVSSRQVTVTNGVRKLSTAPFSFLLSFSLIVMTASCRIVCETTSSGREKSGQASVKVRGGGLGLSAQIFNFQVNSSEIVFSQDKANNNIHKHLDLSLMGRVQFAFTSRSNDVELPWMYIGMWKVMTLLLK